MPSLKSGGLRRKAIPLLLKGQALNSETAILVAIGGHFGVMLSQHQPGSLGTPENIHVSLHACSLLLKFYLGKYSNITAFLKSEFTEFHKGCLSQAD